MSSTKSRPKRNDEQVSASRKAAYRQGILVFAGLAILTAIEFLVAVTTEGSATLLLLAALVKAALIIQYYMHLKDLGGEGETHQ